MFEPSSKTKRWGLYTRKSKFHAGAVTLPGFFSLKRDSNDTLFFFLAMIIEIIGFVAIAASFEWNYLMAALALLFVIVDVALAIFIHWYQADICEEANNAIIAATAAQRNAHLEEKKRLQRKWWVIIFTILLWVLAVVKAALSFNASGDSGSIIIPIVLLLCYLVNALIHTKVTGYYIFQVFYNSQLTKEYDKYQHYLRDNTFTAGEMFVVEAERPFPLTTPDGVNLKECSIPVEDGSGKHSISRTNEGNWMLKTWGVLYDDSVNHLVQAQQNDFTRQYIAIECVKHQFQILQANAYRIQ